MATPSRELILDEIRRTAEANGGQALGRDRFTKATGISQWDVGRYWANFGDAVREAGYEPGNFNRAHDPEQLLMAYADVVRRLGHVPTRGELRLERIRDPAAVPNESTFQRFGQKPDLLRAVVQHLADKPEYADVREVCLAALEGAGAQPVSDTDEGAAPAFGFVYLLKGRGGEYKLGRAGAVDRRVSQLATGSSVDLEVVHEVKTDDPAGVEAYWHKRFADRRLRGEWFKLSASDVRAFKRWRRIY